jgi:hypothetical protein
LRYMNLRADCQRLVTAAVETANTWFLALSMSHS